jgi:hypothetical protein
MQNTIGIIMSAIIVLVVGFALIAPTKYVIGFVGFMRGIINRIAIKVKELF